MLNSVDLSSDGAADLYVDPVPKGSSCEARVVSRSGHDLDLAAYLNRANIETRRPLG